MPNRSFYSSTRDFSAQHPDALKAAIDVINEVEAWEARQSPNQAADIAPQIGLPAPVLKTWFDRQKYGVYRLTPEIFVGRQKIANAFFKLGLIPNRIDVSGAAWNA